MSRHYICMLLVIKATEMFILWNQHYHGFHAICSCRLCWWWDYGHQHTHWPSILIVAPILVGTKCLRNDWLGMKTVGDVQWLFVAMHSCITSASCQQWCVLSDVMPEILSVCSIPALWWIKWCNGANVINVAAIYCFICSFLFRHASTFSTFSIALLLRDFVNCYKFGSLMSCTEACCFSAVCLIVCLHVQIAKPTKGLQRVYWCSLTSDLSCQGLSMFSALEKMQHVQALHLHVACNQVYWGVHPLKPELSSWFSCNLFVQVIQVTLPSSTYSLAINTYHGCHFGWCKMSM